MRIYVNKEPEDTYDSLAEAIVCIRKYTVGTKIYLVSNEPMDWEFVYGMGLDGHVTKFEVGDTS